MQYNLKVRFKRSNSAEIGEDSYEEYRIRPIFLSGRVHSVLLDHTKLPSGVLLDTASYEPR